MSFADILREMDYRWIKPSHGSRVRRVGIMFGEKRKFKRLKAVLPVCLRIVESASLKPVTRSVVGNLCDLTPAGARVDVNTVVVDGLHFFYDVDGTPFRRLELSLEMPDGTGKISFQCHIKWYDRVDRDSQFCYSLGIEMTGITQEDRERLCSFLFSVNKG